MNNLTVINQNGQLVVNSRNVAENFEKEHAKVTRSIENLIEGIAKSGDTYNHLFIESTYEDEQNKQTYKEYLLTRDGFSLLVMGFNGQRALDWKLKYIQAFNQMEQSLKGGQTLLSPKEQLKLQLQILEEQDKKIDGVVKNVADLQANMPLFNIECKELQALVRKIGIKALGGYKTPAYRDNSLRGKVYADIQGQLKRQFGISRYEAIKRSQIESARGIVGNYILPLFLQDNITLLNNQTILKVVN